MRQRLIAQRYAKAIVENFETAQLESLLTDIETLKAVLKQYPEVEQSLHTQLLPLQKRLELVKDVLVGTVNTEKWNSMFQLLIKKHRFILISDIFDEIENMVHERRDEVVVNLKIARDLTPESESKVAEYLKSVLHRTVILKKEIHEELIGGFVAETDSMTIDGSILNSLMRFQKLRK